MAASLPLHLRAQQPQAEPGQITSSKLKGDSTQLTLPPSRDRRRARKFESPQAVPAAHLATERVTGTKVSREGTTKGSRGRKATSGAESLPLRCVAGLFRSCGVAVLKLGAGVAATVVGAASRAP